MNYTFRQESDLQAFESFVLSHGGIYMQSALWANVKEEWKSRFYCGFDEAGERVLSALREIPQRAPVTEKAPALPAPERACSIRQAMLSPRETLPVERAAGRILADACVSCPPAVPVIIAGEKITEQAAECMKYYNITECDVVVNA